MKIIHSIVLLFCITCSAYGQKDSMTAIKGNVIDTTLKIFDEKPLLEKPLKEILFVEFNPGFSLPIGNFASGDYTNSNAGYGKEGYSIGANIMIKLYKGLNFIAGYSRQMNVFDEVSFAKNALASKSNYTITPLGNWKNHFVLGGFTYDIPLEDGNFLTPRFLTGLCLSRTPEYELLPTAKNYTTAVREVTESEEDISIAFKVGVGLKKNITRQLYVALSPDYYFSTTRKNINKPYFNQKPPRQKISIVSVSVSVGFRMFR